MASVVITGDTSGSITLAAPAVAGSNTITLPANTGTVITTASSGQSIPKAALPTGSVLQVVQGTTATGASNSTGTFADTNLSATITPTSSTSKILILVNQGGCYCNANANGINIKILRGATDLGTFAVAYAYSLADMIIGIPINYLDSPATTSSTTYKTQFARFTGSGTVNVQGNSNPSYMILMEIAA